MKNLILGSIVLLFDSTTYQTLYAQILKTSKENYNDGTLTYHYYEDQTTNEWVKSGSFSYTKYLKDGAGFYSEVISGQFKNGLRDGIWSLTRKKVDYPNSGGSYTTETTTSTQSFKNGTPDGQWQANSFWKSRNKLYRNGGYIWGSFDPAHSESVSLTFFNGIARGLVTYGNPKKTTLTLNKNGFVIGSYVFPGVYSNEEITFSNDGIVTKYVSRDRSGRVQNKENFDPALLQAGEKYSVGTISRQQLDELKIKADTVSITKHFLSYSTIFEEDCLILPTLGGDKSYSDGVASTVFNRVYGRYIFLESLK